MVEEEIFKDVIGYEGRYQISSLGRLKSVRRQVNSRFGTRIIKEKFLTKTLLDKGYYMYYLSTVGKARGRLSLHRLIATHFIDNPLNLPCVNHKNAIKTDNRIENLEWCTFSENTLHAHKLGLIKLSDEGKERRTAGNRNNNYRGKKVRDKNTGKEYDSVTYACDDLGFDRGQVYNWLKGCANIYDFPIEYI